MFFTTSIILRTVSNSISKSYNCSLWGYGSLLHSY